jgi:hypothetical protein
MHQNAAGNAILNMHLVCKCSYQEKKKNLSLHLVCKCSYQEKKRIYLWDCKSRHGVVFVWKWKWMDETEMEGVRRMGCTFHLVRWIYAR